MIFTTACGHSSWGTCPHFSMTIICAWGNNCTISSPIQRGKMRSVTSHVMDTFTGFCMNDEGFTGFLISLGGWQFKPEYLSVPLHLGRFRIAFPNYRDKSLQKMCGNHRPHLIHHRLSSKKSFFRKNNPIESP